MTYRDRTIVSRFLRDRNGSFAIAAGGAIAALALSVGFGINLAQLSHVRAALLQSLDAAVTSTARDLTTLTITTAEAETRMRDFLSANGSDGFVRDERINLDALDVDLASRTVRAIASVEVDLAFPLFTTASRRTVTVESAAVYNDQRIEIAMMLDVTGSMAPDRKLDDLKEAASSAARILLDGQNADNPRVRIALIPYSNAVNAGSLAESSVFVERSAAERRQAPGNTAPRAAATRPDNCATERKGTFQFTDHGPGTSMVNRDYLLSDFARDFRTQACPSARVVPLTANLRTIESAIDGFVAEGGTGGHIGIQWSWYMLSERWAGVLQASQRPGPASDRRTRKYAILMTDGEFNLSYFDASRTNQIYNDRGKAAPRDAARTLCRAMRSQGIEIFTIGFKLQDPAARQTMRDCATPDTGATRHYYDTSSGSELNAAFAEIAQSIERLAITR